jgi:hypothetical protein
MHNYFEVSPGIAVGVSFPDRPQPWPRLPRAPFLTRPITVDWDLSPVLSWAPRYPTRVWSRDPYWRAPRSGYTVSPPVPPLIASGMRWEPSYPAPRVHQRTYPAARMPVVVGPSPSVFLVVAQRMGWAPTYPAPRRWTKQYRTDSSAVGAITQGPPATVFPTTGQCVEVIDGTLTRPALISEGLTQPALLTQALSRPALINEAVC